MVTRFVLTDMSRFKIPLREWVLLLWLEDRQYGFIENRNKTTENFEPRTNPGITKNTNKATNIVRTPLKSVSRVSHKISIEGGIH
jgi:hypothetical protein